MKIKRILVVLLVLLITANLFTESNIFNVLILPGAAVLSYIEYLDKRWFNFSITFSVVLTAIYILILDVI